MSRSSAAWLRRMCPKSREFKCMLAVVVLERECWQTIVCSVYAALLPL